LCGLKGFGCLGKRAKATRFAPFYFLHQNLY